MWGKSRMLWACSATYNSRWWCCFWHPCSPLLSPFTRKSLKQDGHEGLADPTGRPLLCWSLIKDSFLVGAPPPSHALASFCPSRFPVMHSVLINYSDVYRSAGSVFLASGVWTSRYTWLCIVHSSADPLFVCGFNERLPNDLVHMLLFSSNQMTPACILP